MREYLLHFFTDLFINYPEGMFLYTGGMITITGLNLYYRKEWDIGAKGCNKIWDTPEQMFVLFVRWIIPHMFISAYCLPEVAKVSDSLLLFAGVIALYALTGRWGLEWLATMKGTTTIKKEVKETSQTNETTNITESKVDNTGNNSSAVN